jgi:hypothetical protein
MHSGAVGLDLLVSEVAAPRSDLEQLPAAFCTQPERSTRDFILFEAYGDLT